MNTLLVLFVLLFVHENAHVFAKNHHHHQNKTAKAQVPQSTPEPNYNLTAIVMSSGRSGSSVLCDYIAHLGSSNKSIEDMGGMGEELFGGGADAMKQLTDPIKKND